MRVKSIGVVFVLASLALLAWCMPGHVAMAQDASDDATMGAPKKVTPAPAPDPDAIPALNQPVSNDKVGTFNAPFGWSVEEIADGVRITEPGHSQPVAIEMALITRPLAVSAKAYAAVLTKELASDEAGFAPRTLDASALTLPKTDQRPEIKDGHQLILQVQEGDHVMHFFVAIVPLGDHLLVASLGAAAVRFEKIEAEKVLNAILASYVLP